MQKGRYGHRGEGRTPTSSVGWSRCLKTLAQSKPGTFSLIASTNASTFHAVSA